MLSELAQGTIPAIRLTVSIPPLRGLGGLEIVSFSGKSYCVTDSHIHVFYNFCPKIVSTTYSCTFFLRFWTS